MSKQPTQQDLLEGIEENIQSTEKQIFHLKRDLDVLPENGVTVERRTLVRYGRNNSITWCTWQRRPFPLRISFSGERFSSSCHSGVMFKG